MDMKGLFYSIMMALFIIPIVALIIFYSQTGVHNIDTNIRANELQYFSESMEKDLLRYLEINGKRALISAVSVIITNGVSLDNAQLRLNEIITNGTLYGKDDPLVNQKNLSWWEQNVSNIANNLGFNIQFKEVEMNITQNDSFNVLFRTRILVNISDENAKMGVLKNITVNATVSIEGIDDPLFPLKTYGRVFRSIKISNVNKNTNLLVNGTNVTGLLDDTISGYAFVKSATSLVFPCSANLSRILVTDSLTDQQATLVSSCFAGFVSQGNYNIPNAIIGKSITGATNAMNLIKNETKIYLDATNKSVWNLSNITSDVRNNYYHDSSGGASFLDRLEGNVTLSPKYQYGLETFLNLTEISGAGIPVKSANSVIDYKYWTDIAGSMIKNGNYDDIFNWFKIDSSSASDYGILVLLK